ncbi:ROK family protein [Streptomyces sp. NPDC059455]|uniref:ROK family transcriptional regulator n=1 Tax=Streptomyces sp. NPDC059455 TaxID=3346837 RepID=UPI00367AECC0
MARPRPASERDFEALSELVELVGSGRATSRGELARATGVAASTITHRVGLLVEHGLLAESGNGESRGGRRPALLSLNAQAGVILSADIGATLSRFAVTDLGADVLAETKAAMDVNEGPERLLGLAVDSFRQLLAGLGRPPSDVRAIGVGVPGPVEPGSGRVVRPQMMAGWDGCLVPDHFRDFPGVPVVAGNDANLMALGEYRARGRAHDHLLFVKVSTGIGCGIVSHGTIHSGTNSAAGDIGHVRLAGYDHVHCACGNTGCVMAVASGGAIAHALREQGLPTRNSFDVAELVAAGNIEARQAVRAAAREVGEVVATMVSFYNPGCIVLGGMFALLSEDLLTDIRSVVYGRALSLATHTLQIELSRLGERAGTVGGAVMASQYLLSPAGLGNVLAGEPWVPSRLAP